MKHTILLSLLAVMTFSAKAQQEVDTTDWKSLYSAAKSSIEKTDYFNATRYLEMASNIRPKLCPRYASQKRNAPNDIKIRNLTMVFKYFFNS